MSRLSFLTTASERTLLLLVTALVLAVHLGGVLAPGWVIRAVPLAAEAQQLLPAAQLVVLAAWTVLGPGPIWLRLPALPVLLLLWAIGWSSGGWERASLRTMDGLLLSTGVAAALVAIGLRCCGLRLRGMSVAEPSAHRHPQFSIRSLIILTTLVALTMGALEWLRPTLGGGRNLDVYLGRLVEISSPDEFASRTTVRQAVLAAALAAASLSAAWCVLRPGAMWLRLIVTAMLAPLLGFYLANLTGSDRQTAFNLAATLSAAAAVVGISVLPLRLWKVRLVRSRSTGFQSVHSHFIKDRLKTCPTRFAPESAS